MCQGCLHRDLFSSTRSPTGRHSMSCTKSKCSLGTLGLYMYVLKGGIRKWELVLPSFSLCISKVIPRTLRTLVLRSSVSLSSQKLLLGAAERRVGKGIWQENAVCMQNTHQVLAVCRAQRWDCSREKETTWGFSAFREIVSCFNKNVHWEAGAKFNIYQNRNDIKAHCGFLLTPQEIPRGKKRKRELRGRNLLTWGLPGHGHRHREAITKLLPH